MNVPWSKRRWERVLVYGLGVSGRAVIRFLRSRGVQVVAVDRRRREELDLGDLLQDPDIDFFLGEDPQILPAMVDGVVVSPGVPMTRPLIEAAKDKDLRVISEVELAYPFLRGRVVGITGTNGKSTTTALTGAMLQAGGYLVEVCGNIGPPLVERIEGPPNRILVVELSSFQLEGIHLFRATAAALLNIAPDHLDRHLTYRQYVGFKRRIFNLSLAGDVAVLSADDPEVAVTWVRSRRRFFSRLQEVEDGCHLQGDEVVEVAPGEKPRTLFRLADLPLPGVHNLENAMAAALLARYFAVEPEALAQALRTFKGLPHRLERVGEWGGVTFYDDSKGTNVAATVKSLEGFPNAAVHLILGGRSKEADFRPLVPVVAQKAAGVYLIGEAAEELARVLGEAVGTEKAETLERAVELAVSRARPGQVVLLSPACASFDQFRDFAHRGERFQALVRSHMEATDG